MKEYSSSTNHLDTTDPQLEHTDDLPQPTSESQYIKKDQEHLPRLYKVYPSKNIFFLKGRIITGTDPWMFLVTNILLVVPSILFAIFVCPYLWAKLSISVPIIFALLFIHTLVLMMRTSFSDPGIIPRNMENETPWDVNITPSLNTDPSFGSFPPPKFTLVNGVELRLKYCETCRIYRPPRASHCRQCDNCIECEDHHCIWLNNCIGRRNYRYFFLFLVSVFVLCLFIATFSIMHLCWTAAELQQEGNYDSFLDVLRNIPISMVLSIYSFIFTWSIGSLLGFHVYLVSMNLTTHEKLRAGGTSSNPFDRGSIFLNCFEVLCRSPPAPHLRWRSRDPAQLYHYQPTLAPQMLREPPITISIGT